MNLARLRRENNHVISRHSHPTCPDSCMCLPSPPSLCVCWQRFAADKTAYTNYVKSLGRTQAMQHEAMEAMQHVGEEVVAMGVDGDAGGVGAGGGSSAGRVGVADDGGSMDADGGEGTAAATNSASIHVSVPGSQMAEHPLMVVPGRVIHMRGREAFVRAIEGDALMPELRRIAVTQR